MGTVHLCVVKLERDCEACLEPQAAIAAPYEERIVEYAAIHANCTVDVVLSQRRCPYYHTVSDVMIFTSLCNPACQANIVVIKKAEIIAEWYIA